MASNLALIISSSFLNIHLVSLRLARSRYHFFFFSPVVTFLGHPSLTFIIFTLGCCTHICGAYLREVQPVGVGCSGDPSGEHQGNDDLPGVPVRSRWLPF